jgi:hypothetical protein
MSRILAIKDPDGEREVDYSSLSSKEINKKLKSYEKKFGGFSKFLRSYNCESGSPEDYLTLIDWECLLNEQKSRKGARLSLVKGSSRKPR